MPPVLTIKAAGPGATIQDAGRFGLLRYGVTPAGPMDPLAFAAANRALGNPPAAAAIEIGLGAIALECDSPVTLAFAGGGFRWSLDDRALPSAARINLRPGETLRARMGSWGAWCYCAAPGGIDVPLVMGSRATHLRSALGGLDGRSLAVGDRLAVASSRPLDDGELARSWQTPDLSPLRVVLGPQEDHFTRDAIATFLGTTWTLSAAVDRMAYALHGPALAHARDYNIVSDGVALGAIQVAGDGKPLVLMADRQPTGGYPKIAHVARADIGRLAQRRPGETCRFVAVDVDTARRALLSSADAMDQVGHRLSPLRVTPAARLLAESNLIDGVTDGGE